ncbi:hypothetical protein K3495_g4032 [Podosphaera aphanis]|nr:hypothetical protein K3495_g4032 [Podosphaera aphanis]
MLESIDQHSLQDPESKQYENETCYEKGFFNWEDMYAIDNLDHEQSHDVQSTKTASNELNPDLRTSHSEIEYTYPTPQSQDHCPTENEFIVSTGRDQGVNESRSDIESSESYSIGSTSQTQEQSEECGTTEEIDVNRIPHNVATRAGEISAHLDEQNILSEGERRPRKAPRRDIYALAGTYEAFYTSMAAAVNNSERIGGKLPYVSSLKPPPHTWKQMIRHTESN